MRASATFRFVESRLASQIGSVADTRSRRNKLVYSNADGIVSLIYHTEPETEERPKETVDSRLRPRCATRDECLLVFIVEQNLVGTLAAMLSPLSNQHTRRATWKHDVIRKIGTIIIAYRNATGNMQKKLGEDLLCGFRAMRAADGHSRSGWYTTPASGATFNIALRANGSSISTITDSSSSSSIRNAHGYRADCGGATKGHRGDRCSLLA